MGKSRGSKGGEVRLKLFRCDCCQRVEDNKIGSLLFDSTTIRSGPLSFSISWAFSDKDLERPGHLCEQCLKAELLKAVEEGIELIEEGGEE